MQVEDFWRHWQVTEDPFRAEEAREDPVFGRLSSGQTTHPEFQKVYGQPDRPGAAVVFGEKGSGKTALRLMMEQRIREHNIAHREQKAWVIVYDDLNGVFDRFASNAGEQRHTDRLLERFTLSDHQDAILSLAVTRLVSDILGRDPDGSADDRRKARKMDWAHRLDLALLAALYDQPESADFATRFRQLSRTLRLGWFAPIVAAKWLGVVSALTALGLWAVSAITSIRTALHVMVIGLLIASALVLLGYWTIRSFQLWSLTRRVGRALRTVGRPQSELGAALALLPIRELSARPLPGADAADSRYQLTARLMQILRTFGYTSLIILVDRIDEPVRIHGDAGLMRAVVWPLLDNKFLQQDGVGIKLLLPAELRRLLAREDSGFFQRSRLDKQHMIERLLWTGATLYDMCSRRLAACRPSDADPITLTDLFDEDVARQDLIDALDQMHQPRDAMKFLYRVVQEHCSNVSVEEPNYRVPRLVLHAVRKLQSQRLQDLERGIVPA